MNTYTMLSERIMAETLRVARMHEDMARADSRVRVLCASADAYHRATRYLPDTYEERLHALRTIAKSLACGDTVEQAANWKYAPLRHALEVFATGIQGLGAAMHRLNAACKPHHKRRRTAFLTYGRVGR